MKQENLTPSAIKLKKQMDVAIEDGFITREEYDNIINTATEDNVIDRYEEVLLKEFHQMIYDKTIKFKKS